MTEISYPKHPKIKPKKTDKRDIIRGAQKQLRGAITREAVESVFTAALEFTYQQLIDGNPVDIPGWGSLVLKRGKPKPVLLPSKEWVISGTHRRVKFLTSSIFTALIRQQKERLLQEPAAEQVSPENSADALKIPKG